MWVIERMGKNFLESGTLLDSSVPYQKRLKKERKRSCLQNRSVERPSSLPHSQTEQTYFA